MDVKKTDVKKKKFSALISGLVMILVICSIIGICLWANTEDPMPIGVLLFLLIPLAVVIIGIIIAITQRFKEIKEGEEDAASNY